MKKIVMAICGVVVFCWGAASLRSGALKADNLLQESSVVERTVPESSTVAEPAAPEAPAAPEPIQETPTPEPSADEPSGDVSEAPSVKEPTESAPAEEPVSEPIPESSTIEPSSSDSSITESSTKGESTESSTSGTSGSQTSSSTASSTSKSDTSTASNTSSSTTSSSSSSTGTTTTSSSTSQEQPSTPSAPSAPGSIPNPAPSTPTPPVQSEPKVQASAAVIQETPAAFSETSTLQLPSELKTAEVAQSDLKGYELPLLSSFENKAQAALIYDGIKKLGIEQEPDFNTEHLAAKLYSDLFGIEITGTPEKQADEISVGSLLYRKKDDQLEMIGVSIGKDYYLTAEDVEVEVSPDATKIEANEDIESSENDNEQNNEESDKKEKQRQVVLQPMDIDEEVFVQTLPDVTLTEYGQTILAEYPASINFTENEASKKFISTIAEDARKLGQEYDVFASVMIAQALLESGSGSSSLSLPPNYNLFGVKGTYQGQAVSMATQEDRGNGDLYSINSAFRKYPNYAASLGDYVQLLRGGISGNDGYYQKAWRSTAKNYLRSTHALTGTYATDTSYDRKLNSIIAVYNLTQYDRVKVDQSSGVFIKGKEEIPKEYRSMMRYPDYNGINYNTSGSYPVGQCTWYAFNRVKQLGKSVDDFMGNGGEWGTKGKALGYEVSREPKAGWLISFTPGTAGSDPRYGHVAFVEVVRPEGILISEGNVYGGTVISYRVIDANLAKSDLVTYIKAK
ncbi:glucosaminidase domain-containing protein [Candidatus Enterococcus murrayae]|uniref:Glucosaminidase domain-containing protein n=1 Tax=Candidatus Enterococcus murrayae TaxID=2815321 RepID=A0ABS3HHH1_9ENTE|nr:glucosaminidase domain-containing protein [Enterococcus sp. MJM16]MBO0452905.1 glucosaminidase domain-containing protein [Enterococcus sp. MJM16]